MKERIDKLLVERGFFKTRDRAKTALMEGVVFVDGQLIDKAGTKVDEASDIVVKGKDLPYVSRGGLKLEKALDEFGIELDGEVCTDIGASTGGFTDLMLSRGASKVYAVDVGYGQLDWKLRNDPRVVNMEKCNARYLTEKDIPESSGFITADVSFISLSLILPVISMLLKADGHAVCLVKPQFEAGKEETDRGKGVIKDPDVQERVLVDTINNAKSEGLYTDGITYSPIKGAKGNIEFLISLVNVEKLGYNQDCVLKKVHDTVKASHEILI